MSIPQDELQHPSSNALPHRPLTALNDVILNQDNILLSLKKFDQHHQPDNNKIRTSNQHSKWRRVKYVP